VLLRTLGRQEFYRQQEADAMAMGKRETEQQQDLFITYDRLPRSPDHVFYQKLNGLLGEAGFDRWF
jgi:hypothetical protein